MFSKLFQSFQKIFETSGENARDFESIVFNIHHVLFKTINPVKVDYDRLIDSNEVFRRKEGNEFLQGGVVIEYFVVRTFNSKTISCVSYK